RVDAHMLRITREHRDHRRVCETALRVLSEPSLALGLDDRHAMEGDLASRRRNPADRPHHRIDAGGQALADIRPRLAVGLEAPDDAGDPQFAQNMAERHRGDHIAAARVEEYDSFERLVFSAGLEEIDESLRRRGLDDAVGDDHVRTAGAATADVKRLDPEG